MNKRQKKKQANRPVISKKIKKKEVIVSFFLVNILTVVLTVLVLLVYRNSNSLSEFGLLSNLEIKTFAKIALFFVGGLGASGNIIVVGKLIYLCK